MVPLIPIQLVKFPCRFSIRLSILSSNWQMHRMSPPNITPNHPLMCDILPDLPPKLWLDPQILQRVYISLSIRDFLFPCLSLLGGFRFCGWQVLDRCVGWRWSEIRRGEWVSGHWGCCSRGGEKGREGGDLIGRQTFNFAFVVDLETGAETMGGFVTYAIEMG